MSIAIRPSFLKIKVNEKDNVEDREQDMKTLLHKNDFDPEEERGVEFLGLKGNCYTFKVDGITSAYLILQLFTKNYVDGEEDLDKMKYHPETRTLTITLDR